MFLIGTSIKPILGPRKVFVVYLNCPLLLPQRAGTLAEHCTLEPSENPQGTFFKRSTEVNVTRQY